MKDVDDVTTKAREVEIVHSPSEEERIAELEREIDLLRREHVNYTNRLRASRGSLMEIIVKLEQRIMRLECERCSP